MAKIIKQSSVGKSFSIGKKVITLNDKTSDEDIDLIYSKFPNLFTLDTQENVKNSKNSVIKATENTTVTES